MNLSETDIATIHALLTDYQWYLDNYHEFVVSAYAYPMFTTVKDMRPYRAARDRIANTAPLLIKVLSMELPAGFTLLKTIDEQCYAWNSHVTLGLHGPVSEFQARLWCWQNENLNDDIAHSQWLEEVRQKYEDEKVTIHGVDEAVSDITGFLSGTVVDSSARLEPSAIDNIFKYCRG